jgi:hypothetical protein
MITLEWIKERIKVNPETACWEWQGTKDKDGYGRFGEYLGGGRKNRIINYIRIHRRVWELTKGPIPDGKCVCHTCDNPCCCNSEHLWLGTIHENNTDRANKRRSNPAKGDEHYFRRHPEAIPKGTRRPFAKLTDEKVAEIHRRKAARLCSIRALEKELASEMNVCVGTIKKAMWGQTWKHVAAPILVEVEDE